VDIEDPTGFDIHVVGAPDCDFNATFTRIDFPRPDPLTENLAKCLYPHYAMHLCKAMAK